METVSRQQLLPAYCLLSNVQSRPDPRHRKHKILVRRSEHGHVQQSVLVAGWQWFEDAGVSFRQSALEGDAKENFCLSRDCCVEECTINFDIVVDVVVVDKVVKADA